MPYLWCHQCNSTILHSWVLKNLEGKETFNKLKSRGSKRGKKSSLHCPSCTSHFNKVPYKKVEIELCPRCSTIFLDPKELEALSLDSNNYTAPKEDVIELEVMHWTDAYSRQENETEILGFLGINVKGKRVIDYPLVSIFIMIISAFLLRNPNAAAKYIFDPSHPTILSFFGHVFIHGNLAHILGNLYFFIVFSTTLEQYIGHKKILELYFFCIVLTTLGYMKFGPDIPVIGLSGVVMCSMGAMLSLFPQGRLSLLKRLRGLGWRYNRFMMKISLPIYMYVIPFILIDIYNHKAFGFTKGISYLSHIIGFACGFFLVKVYKIDKR